MPPGAAQLRLLAADAEVVLRMTRPLLPPAFVLVLACTAIQAQSPLPQAAIPGVITEGARVELVRGGFHGLEGPVATPDGGLLFSDTVANRTYRLDLAGTVSTWRENTNGTNGSFLLRDGRLLAAESGGRRIVSVTQDGDVTILATQFAGQPLRAPNDLIPDRKGGIYFTDPAPRPAPDVAPKQPGNVLKRTGIVGDRIR